MLHCDVLQQAIRSVSPLQISGHVTEILGPVIKAALRGVSMGELVSITPNDPSPTNKPLLAQVMALKENHVVFSPLGPIAGIAPGSRVFVTGHVPQIRLGPDLRGSVLNFLGEVLYREPEGTHWSIPQSNTIRASINNLPPSPLERKAITQPLITGVRAIDAFVPLGHGQRMLILAEPGVGKSSLMSMIASNASVDVNVFALIGERGREVKELLFETLSSEARKRSIFVVSTSDEAAACRVLAAQTAVRIAEYFRDAGLNVLLQLDSLTRLVRAYREVGLAAGEVPVRRGYPPSVFSALPQFIERTGTNDKGAITALYTVLLSSDVDEDPMVEEAKGLTDGHLMLRRELAEAGHYPAIDILGSVSRLSNKLQGNEFRQAVLKLRRLYARLQRDKELVMLGGQGDAELQRALEIEEEFNRFLCQGTSEAIGLHQTMQEVLRLASR